MNDYYNDLKKILINNKDRIEILEDFLKKYKIEDIKKQDKSYSKALLKSLSQKSLDKNAKVAVGGALGSYADKASRLIFSDIIYFKRFTQIIDAIEKGDCKYGILPIENSSYGSVKEVYNLMLKRNFYILGSLKLDISHCLLGKNGAKISDIKEVYSHPQALGQCKDYIENHNFIEKEYYNTALSARLVKDMDDKSKAAIASSLCGDLYGLEILDKNIQDEKNNYTRFIIIGKDLEIFENANKISLRLKAFDKPGSLFEIIDKFKILGINMTKLESAPIPGSDFEFVFYFDFDGNIRDTNVRILIDYLKNKSKGFRFLGNYIDFFKLDKAKF